MTIQEQILQQTAEHFQEDCHRTVEVIMLDNKSGAMIPQDATNVWLYRKLAEMEIRIKELESINGL